VLVSVSMTAGEAGEATFLHKPAGGNHAKLPSDEETTRSEASTKSDELKNGSSVPCSVRLVRLVEGAIQQRCAEYMQVY